MFYFFRTSLSSTDQTTDEEDEDEEDEDEEDENHSRSMRNHDRSYPPIESDEEDDDDNNDTENGNDRVSVIVDKFGNTVMH